MNLNDTDKNRIIELIKAGENRPRNTFTNYLLTKKMYSCWNGRKEDVTNVALPFHSIEHRRVTQRNQPDPNSLILWATTQRLDKQIDLGR